MSNPISNQAIPLSYDDQLPISRDAETMRNTNLNAHNQGQGYNAGHDRTAHGATDAFGAPNTHHVHSYDAQDQGRDAHRVHREDAIIPPRRDNEPFSSHPPTIGSTNTGSRIPHTESPAHLSSQEAYGAPSHAHGAQSHGISGTTDSSNRNFERNVQQLASSGRQDTEPYHPSISAPATGKPLNRNESYDIDGQPKPPPGHQAHNSDEHSNSKPSFGDKVIGTTEKLAGKIMNNAGLEEKGVQRSHGTTPVSDGHHN